MGMRNILRLWSEALRNGESVKVSSGETYTLKPSSDDTGALNIGDGTTDWDVKLFLGSTSNYVLGDVGNNLLQLEGVDLLLGDDDELRLGDGTSGDRVVTWNGTYLECGEPAGMWANAPSPADPQYHAAATEFFDDFNRTPTVGAADTADWLITLVDGGVDGGETYVLADDAEGGHWEIVTNDADNDSNSLQLNGESFKCAAGKKMWFECKFKIDNAGLAEYFIGLAEAVAGENIDAPDDCIGFLNQDATSDETIKFVGDKATAQDLNDSSVDLVDDTFVTVGFFVDGVTSVKAYIDGTYVAALDLASANIPIQALSPLVSVRNASAAASTLTIDYIKVVLLR